jgi:hypothetical protein
MTFKLTEDTTLEEIIAMTEVERLQAIANTENDELVSWYGFSVYEASEGYTLRHPLASNFEDELKAELLKRLG